MDGDVVVGWRSLETRLGLGGMVGVGALEAVLERVFIAGTDGSTMVTKRLRLSLRDTCVGCFDGNGDGIVEGGGCTLGTGVAGAVDCCVGTLGSDGCSVLVVGIMCVSWLRSILSSMRCKMDLSCRIGLGSSEEVYPINARLQSASADIRLSAGVIVGFVISL